MHFQTIGILQPQPGQVPEPALVSLAVETAPGGQVPSASHKRDRRREARYPCRESAEVRILSGELGPLPATILDMSQSGLRLEIGARLPHGTTIAVVLPKNVIVFGRIRYCRSTGEAFQTGISIDDVFYSNHIGGPDHLHDHQLTLYLLKEGLTAAETFSVRDHLQRCQLCAARYHDALREKEKPLKESAQGKLTQD